VSRSVSESFELLAYQLLRLPGQGGPLEQHAADPVPECADTPSLHPAHLRVEFALDRVFKIQNLFEVAPAHMLSQGSSLGLLGPGFDEADRVEQILAAETTSVTRRQLSRRCRDNLFTISGALAAENFLTDSGADLPVH
jgi:hypothetical protein